MEFKTQYKPIEIDYEVLSYEVKTVPDMSISVKDIIARFTRGSIDPYELYISGHYDGINEDEIDNIPYNKEDISDFEADFRRGFEIVYSIRESQYNSNHQEANSEASESSGESTGGES